MRSFFNDFIKNSYTFGKFTFIFMLSSEINKFGFRQLDGQVGVFQNSFWKEN